jgi:hypothetical protein
MTKGKILEQVTESKLLFIVKRPTNAYKETY